MAGAESSNNAIVGDNTSTLYFGKAWWGLIYPNTKGFDGVIDDIGIWNRALTGEEIQQLYQSELIEGCTDNTACNYNPDAGIDDGTCTYPQEFYNCDGVCLNDFNSNGICDEVEVYGCEYPTACNYNPQANVGDGSCIFPEPYYDCQGNCLLDLNNNDLCDLEEISGCTSPKAINYEFSATLDDGSCQYTCDGDIDGNGNIDTNDLLIFLSAFGNLCSGAGCTDADGCNFDPEATFDDGSCVYAVEYYDCEGLPLNDADGDGVPDELEVLGCTDLDAFNYNPLATEDDGSCQSGIQGDAHSCGAENVHNPELVYGSVSDIDGNTYRTIVIGNQEWMAENLNTSRYANGDLIPNITFSQDWVNATSGAWCYYNNDMSYACPYGKLYNWFVTVDYRNVCPAGWHVPSDAEWTALTNYVGGVAVAGGKMKSVGLDYWVVPNQGATNETGFSGLPGGYRALLNGSFGGFDAEGAWWSSSEFSLNTVLSRYLLSFSGDVNTGGNSRSDGLSVRCLRD